MGRILIIEDNVILISMMQFILEHQGHHVLLAKTGKDGLHYVDQEKVDLVITDLGLPFASGYEIIEHIRTGQLNKDVPIIIISASLDTNCKVDGLRLGANDFIRKPISTSELISRVQLQMTK